MRLVDTHAHLNFDQFDEDRGDVVERCRSCLHAVINPGTDYETCRDALQLAEEYPGFIFPAAGMHPTAAAQTDPETVEDVARFVEEYADRLVAVGEIGLDYHHAQENGKREEQEDVFHRFLALAEDLGKPVIVHSRDAEKQCVNILEEYDVDGVLHSFNGIPLFAEQATGNGLRIGVSTQVLYSSQVRTLVNELSLEHLLLETDAPFLYRGERNHPANVKQVAQEVSDIKTVSMQHVVARTNQNVVDTFPLLADEVDG